MLRTIETDGLELKFLGNSRVANKRIDTFFTKEPDTLDWIRGMKRSDGVFFDIGANVGMYTVFAAKRGLRVVAFEPESLNFSFLCQNLHENDLPVWAYPVALSDRSGPGILYLKELHAGQSCHSLERDYGYDGLPKNWAFDQGTIQYRLDDFVGQIGILPDHVKIDVDGLEHKVIEGFGHLRPKSILIELNQNLEEHQLLVEKMMDWGYLWDTDQVEKARRKSGPMKNVGNWIFHKS